MVAYFFELVANTKTPEISVFRQLRQTFLTEIGQLLDGMTCNRIVNYPRGFLGEIVAGIQVLNKMLPKEMIEKLVQHYRPWSEELVQGLEISRALTKDHPAFCQEIINASAGQKRKLEKGMALLNAFDALRHFLEGHTMGFNPPLEEALLEFDRAYWEYMYIFYEPVPKEKLESEFNARFKQQAQEMIACHDGIRNDPVLEEEFDDMIDSLLLLESCEGTPKEEIIMSILSGLDKPLDFSAYQGRLLDFIRDYFEIAFQSPLVKDLSEVTEFYFPDIHDSLGHRVLYTAFVDLFTTLKSCVLIESPRGPCKARENFHSLWMKTTARIRGWDMNHQEAVQNRIDIKLIKLTQSCEWLMGNIIDPNYKGSKRRLVKALLEAFSSSMQRGAFEEFQKKMQQVNLAIPETFQARNRLMIQAVTEEAPSADIIVLIGGEAHLLKQKPREEPLSFIIADNEPNLADPRFDLQEVHAFLSQRKAMILLPKQEKVREAERPYINLQTKAWAAMCNRPLA